MADVYVKTVEGGETTTPTSSHYVELDDGTNSTYLSIVNLAIYVWNYLTSLTAKTTLVDADQIPLADSAASNAGKKITWQNFMAQVAAYTQTLTNKTLTAPTIADFTNAAHDHGDADDGGAIVAAAVGLTTQGDILYRDGSGLARLAAGTSGQVLQTLGAGANPQWATASGGDPYNFLVNGGFDFAERNVTPGTLFTVADKDYGADRWWVTRENADVQYNVNDATGETGLTCKNYGTYKKITNAGKFVVVQVIEGVNSVPLRSKEITFQMKMKASGSKTIRMAVLELQNAGTIDAPPATLVTAFGADTVDPTFGTNVAIITAAASKSVTTSWQSFSVTVTIPSNSKNVMAAFWTDSDFAANDTLSVAEAGLFVTASVQAWKPRLIQQEQALCQRFYYRWGYENSDTGTGFRMFGYGGAGVYEGQTIKHPVTMRAIPTSVVNGTWGTTNITGTPSIVDQSTHSATFSMQVTALGAYDIFTNGTDDWISFEAEIL